MRFAESLNHDDFVNPEDRLTFFANIGTGDGATCSPLP